MKNTVGSIRGCAWPAKSGREIGGDASRQHVRRFTRWRSGLRRPLRERTCGSHPGEDVQTTIDIDYRGPLRLFCFPWAGASAAVFRDWSRHLQPHVEVAAMELPGRGARCLEAL